MKVLLVSPLSDNLVGGIVSWTKYVVNYHRGNPGDVDLRLLNNVNAAPNSYGKGLFGRLKSGMRNYLPVIKQFKVVVAKEQFDVAHICTSAQLGLMRDLIIVRIAKKKGIKTFVHMHFGRIPEILDSKGWENRLFCKLLKNIDCAVVMDKASLDALQSHGYANTVYLPNPLSTEVQRLISSCEVAERKPRTIVYAGHVQYAKGVCELVEACRELPDIHLSLLGKVTSEGIKEKLYEIAGEGSESWLEIPGNKPMQEVISAMKSCAIFTLPSYTEGFPNVILESMACGCPIVATSVGAIPEMLTVDSDTPCGVCVPAQDVPSLRKALVDFLENPQKAFVLGNNARHRVYEEYEISKVWKQLVGIWKETCK